MKILKWVGIIVGAIIVIILIAAGTLYVMGNSKLNRTYATPVEELVIPTDAAAIARGEHLVIGVSACIGCHGEGLSGALFIDDPSFATLPVPNLTSGNGGVGGNYSDEDWVRAIRHGVAADGRGLLAGMMPSNFYWNMNDADLGAVVAYVKSLPPVDNTLAPRQLSLLAKILMAVGALNLQPEVIDHATRPPSPEAGVSVDYGEYLTKIAVCQECHAQNFAGNTDPNGPPMGPNLTPGGELQGWSQEDFVTALRTGMTPDGRTLSEEMPWIEYRNMTDDELAAIWMFLQTQPALPNNS